MAFTSQFTLAEILSLLGLVQSVYVLVYMLLRSGTFSNAVVPSLYFGTLAAAFFFDAAAGRWSSGIAQYESYQWLFWFSGIPLGALLIFQLAQVPHPLRPKYFFLLLLVPISFLPCLVIDEPHIVYVSGLVIGGFSLLAIWLRRDLLDGLRADPKFGKERFWLILALITMHTAFLGVTLGYISNAIGAEQWVGIRTLLGIAFVYLAATSLFRIYPQAFKITERKEAGVAPVRSEDQSLLDRLNSLLETEKVYQDPVIGRAELARELKIGEATLSRLVNAHYNKTIPQILNELRVKDAQKLLKETNASIQNIFEESGFNSITTFNRVFKELSGDSPKEYRARFRL
jgi:AraC-like DNA-binding protein